MKTPKLYYTAPTDKQFNELKSKAIEIWRTYDNEFGYVDEKVGQIEGLKNMSDNFMYMVAMFDSNNQWSLAQLLSDETRQAVHDRIIDGGGFDGIFNARESA